MPLNHSRHLLRWMVLALLLPILTGCWDRQEIEDRASVSAIAVDMGKKEELQVSMQIPIPSQLAGGTSGGGGTGGGGGGAGPSGPFQVFTEEGKTIGDALSKIENQIHQPLFYGNIQVILFGEEFAKNGIGRMIDILRRTPEIRRQLWPVVIKGGKAKEALLVKTTAEQIPTDYIRDLLKSGSREEIFPQITLGRLFKDLSSRKNQFPLLNYIIPTESAFKWEGLAIFNEDRMVGSMDHREDLTEILQIREERTGRLVPVQRDGGFVVFKPNELNRKIHVNPDGSIDIQVLVRGSIREKSSKDDLSDPKVLHKLEKIIQTRYEKMAKKVLDRSQKELKSDVFGLGKMVRAYQPAIWKQMNWQKDYPNVPVKISYHVVIRRFGLSAK